MRERETVIETPNICFSRAAMNSFVILRASQ